MRMIVVLLAFVLAFAFSLPDEPVPAQSSSFIGEVAYGQTKTKKRRKKRRRRGKKKKKGKAAQETKETTKQRSVVTPVEEEESEKEEKEPSPEEDPPLTPEQLEEQRVEAAKRKLEAERRTESRVTPGTASRWSNRGAMTPIATAVPVTAELPQRAVPITQTVETPGQSLLGGGREEILSARLSLSGYHLQTSGTDRVLGPTQLVAGNGTVIDDWATPFVQNAESRDLNFLRARATMGYDHIAGSDFALRFDLEYRPKITGSRFTDYRLNEAYVSYGLTEFRGRDEAWWGVALGRLAVREAGYAQADGLAARFKITDWLRAGAFGGVTGNPYGYNWNQRNTEVFSADWYTGGAFVSFQIPEVIVNLAGVVTYANIAANLADFDRAYLYLDAAWLILPELNFIVNGWLDMLPDGQVVQNLNGTLSWTPFDELSLALGGGRFSTVLYAVSGGGYTFLANGDNEYIKDANLDGEGEGSLGVIVGEDGQPIVPFDAVLMTSVYNNVWVRGSYRIFRDLEAIARYNVVIRDASTHQNQLRAEVQNTIEPSTLRMLPGAGLRYRNPDVVDAHVDFTYILDDESQADAVVSGGLGRGLFGLYLSGDIRYYVGEISGFDGGVLLSYTFPRDWFPGALSLRGMFRYFRENVALYNQQPDVSNVVRLPEGGVTGWDTLFNQETFLGYGGIEWRL